MAEIAQKNRFEIPGSERQFDMVFLVSEIVRDEKQGWEARKVVDSEIGKVGVSEVCLLTSHVNWYNK